MPPWFIDIESATEIEAKSNGVPPASRIAAQASRASSPSSALHGVTRPSVEATPTNGLAMSASERPRPRRNARCGARSSPSTVTREGRIGMRFFVAKGIGYSAGLGSILSGIKQEESMLRAGLALLAALLSCASWAQSYPSHPIKIIVPYGVGGSADVYARFLGAKLQGSLGQPIVIENRPGGGAVVGTDAVAKADPDGYTLLMMSNTHTVNETLIPKKPFDLMRDLAPITGVSYSDLMMVVHPSVQAGNLKDFIV